MNRSNKSATGSKLPIQTKATSFQSHIPNITGTDTPPKEGELRCYECGQKCHIKPQCPKLKGKKELPEWNLKKLLKRTAKWMSLWQEYLYSWRCWYSSQGGRRSEWLFRSRQRRRPSQIQLGWTGIPNNLIHFINEDKVIDTQMHIAAGTVDNMVEPVYDYCTWMKDHARPSHLRNNYRAISVFWEIDSVKAHCLIDSGCEGIMIPLNSLEQRKLKLSPLKNQLEDNWQ